MTSPTPDNDPLDEEAVAWFVRMQSDQRTVTDEDRFAQWFKHDERHRQAYMNVESIWRAAAAEIGPRELKGESRASRPALPERRRTWRSVVGVAAVLTVVTVGGYFGLQLREQISTGVYSTAVGEQRELKLADGSTITLNTRSAVSVDISGEHRSIRLTQGEARFQVAKDHSRPFIVDAGDARVRAVGTAFDVKVSRERVAVTLVEGVVEVTPIIQPASMRTPSVLTAGQVLSIEHGSGKQLIESVAVERASAWLGRQLVFDSTPLVDAVTEANRYLPQPIVIEDLSLMRMAVSGVIRAGNVDNFIAALESSFPVKAIKRADGQVALVKRTDERAQRRAD